MQTKIAVTWLLTRLYLYLLCEQERHLYIFLGRYLVKIYFMIRKYTLLTEKGNY